MPRIAYVNGQYVPHSEAGVHVEDRGFQFADSVYEVIALIDGHLADEAGHLDRLERSLSELAIDLPMSRRSMKIVLRELVRRNRIRSANVYMQVSRGVAARDFRCPRAAIPGIVMTIRPAVFNLSSRLNAAKKVVTTPDLRWKRRDIKTTMLLAQVLAREYAIQKGADDAWMVDEEGYVTEGAASNAWILDGKGNLLTRPTGHAILKGVTRSALQALCRQHKIRIVERAFTAAEAYKAKEAFMSSAVQMIAPVVSIDGKKIGTGKPGPVTQKLIEMYMEYAANPKSRQHEWDAK